VCDHWIADAESAFGRRVYWTGPYDRPEPDHPESSKKKAASIDTILEADPVFAYIAGYTEGGAPYGLTWEEYESADHDSFNDADIPVWSSGFKLGSGQMVTVVGMPIVISHREMVLAREVTIRGSVFVVRDRNGEPMWEMDRPIQMDPDVGDNSLPVC
jgi:hypothetical protein